MAGADFRAPTDDRRLMAQRESLLSQTFVQLTDTLVADFDLVELLTVLADRTVELLDAAAAGILLADPRGVLQVMAASSEQAHLLELFQLQNQEGPCLDCYRTGEAVINVDLAAIGRWTRYAPEALAAGYRSVHAVPMKLRDDVIGALNILMDDRVVTSAEDLALAQALADTATIAILHSYAVAESQRVTAQLQLALSSRVILEQATGMLAERAHLGLDEAFRRLRHYARKQDRLLGAVAAELLDGSLTLAQLNAGGATRP